MKNYQVLISPETFEKVGSYLEQLKSGTAAGRYLFDRLKQLDLHQITTIEFIQLLVRTKRPQIFAEVEIYGNGIDWNQTELSILGDDKHLDCHSSQNPTPLNYGGWVLGVGVRGDKAKG